MTDPPKPQHGSRPRRSGLVRSAPAASAAPPTDVSEVCGEVQSSGRRPALSPAGDGEQDSTDAATHTDGDLPHTGHVGEPYYSHNAVTAFSVQEDTEQPRQVLHEDTGASASAPALPSRTVALCMPLEDRSSSSGEEMHTPSARDRVRRDCVTRSPHSRCARSRGETRHNHNHQDSSSRNSIPQCPRSSSSSSSTNSSCRRLQGRSSHPTATPEETARDPNSIDTVPELRAYPPVPPLSMADELIAEGTGVANAARLTASAIADPAWNPVGGARPSRTAAAPGERLSSPPHRGSSVRLHGKPSSPPPSHPPHGAPSSPASSTRSAWWALGGHAMAPASGRLSVLSATAVDSTTTEEGGPPPFASPPLLESVPRDKGLPTPAGGLRRGRGMYMWPRRGSAMGASAMAGGGTGTADVSARAPRAARVGRAAAPLLSGGSSQKHPPPPPPPPFPASLAAEVTGASRSLQGELEGLPSCPNMDSLTADGSGALSPLTAHGASTSHSHARPSAAVAAGFAATAGYTMVNPPRRPQLQGSGSWGSGLPPVHVDASTSAVWGLPAMDGSRSPSATPTCGAGASFPGASNNSSSMFVRQGLLSIISSYDDDEGAMDTPITADRFYSMRGQTQKQQAQQQSQLPSQASVHLGNPEPARGSDAARPLVGLRHTPTLPALPPPPARGGMAGSSGGDGSGMLDSGRTQHGTLPGHDPYPSRRSGIYMYSSSGSQAALLASRESASSGEWAGGVAAVLAEAPQHPSLPAAGCLDSRRAALRRRWRREEAVEHTHVLEEKPYPYGPPWEGLDTIYCILNRKYVVYRHELGRGSFSRVHLCYNTADHMYYAVKILDKSRLQRRGLGGEGAALQVRHEIVVMRHLRHRNILALREVFNHPLSRKAYLVMELAERGEVVHMRGDGTIEPFDDGLTYFPEEVAARVVKGVLRAMLYAHHLRVAHRDVKPSNILLTADGEVKLADFGVSVFVNEFPTRVQREGSVPFLSPELLACTEVEASAWTPSHSSQASTTEALAAQRGVAQGHGLAAAAAAATAPTITTTTATNATTQTTAGAGAAVERFGRVSLASLDSLHTSVDRTDARLSRGPHGTVPGEGTPASSVFSSGRGTSAGSGMTAASPAVVRPVDLFKADVFSLGVTTFTLLVGRLPWHATDAVSQRECVRNCPDPFLPLYRCAYGEDYTPPCVAPVSDEGPQAGRVMESPIVGLSAAPAVADRTVELAGWGSPLSASMTAGTGVVEGVDRSGSLHPDESVDSATSVEVLGQEILRDKVIRPYRVRETVGLPDAEPRHGAISALAVDFVRCCLCMDASERHSVFELYQHPWIQSLLAVLADRRRDERRRRQGGHRRDHSATTGVSGSDSDSDGSCARGGDGLLGGATVSQGGGVGVGGQSGDNRPSRCDGDGSGGVVRRDGEAAYDEQEEANPSLASSVDDDVGRTRVGNLSKTLGRVRTLVTRPGRPFTVVSYAVRRRDHRCAAALEAHGVPHAPAPRGSSDGAEDDAHAPEVGLGASPHARDHAPAHAHADLACTLSGWARGVGGERNASRASVSPAGSTRTCTTGGGEGREAGGVGGGGGHPSAPDPSLYGSSEGTMGAVSSATGPTTAAATPAHPSLDTPGWAM